MKKLFFVMYSLLFISVQGQDLSQFFDPAFAAEQTLQNMASFDIGDKVTDTQMQSVLFQNGIQLSLDGAGKVRRGIDILEDKILGTNIKTSSEIQAEFESAGCPITIEEAQDIADHFSGGDKKGQNSHVYVIALLGNQQGAELISEPTGPPEDPTIESPGDPTIESPGDPTIESPEDPTDGSPEDPTDGSPEESTEDLVEEIIKESQRPARPDSPTSISVKRVVKRGLQLQRIMMPKSSGDDWLGDAYAQVNTTYISYDDELANGSGKEKGLSMVLGGELNEKMSLSFGLGRSRNHRGGENKTTSTSYGGDVMVHYKFNDNYGLGAYTFYQETDIEDYNSNAYGYGGGMVFSTWHDFEYFYISSAHSVTRTFYEYGNDTLYVGALWIGKDWTDSFATAFTVGFVDSLTSSVTGDNTYWTMGGEVSYIVNEKIDLILGYEKTLALDDYKSDLFQLGFTWKF